MKAKSDAVNRRGRVAAAQFGNRRQVRAKRP